ncbi:hypothetical protein [Wolbachia endosymbiont of Nomada ferruginata]|nr:hypothetical protein [Wolbachia endosymbiont of Nomada ferruginata]
MSSQCLTLESRKLNFTPGNKNWIPVSATFICHANCLQIAMFIQL